MRIYEELFIIKPDAPDEEVDQFVEQLRTQLTTAGATVDKVDKWGKRRLAYRVVWANPLKGSPRYEPLARGMAAALPSVDVFLSGHNLESLEALAEALSP